MDNPLTYRFGRFLQLLGLLIAPAGIAGNLSRPDEVGVKATLVIALTGIGVFVLGWMLQNIKRA